MNRSLANCSTIILTILLSNFALANSGSAHRQRDENLKKCQQFFRLSEEQCIEYFKYNWRFREPQSDCATFDIERSAIEDSDTAASSAARKGNKIVEKTDTRLVIKTNGETLPNNLYFYTSKAACKSDKRK